VKEFSRQFRRRRRVEHHGSARGRGLGQFKMLPGGGDDDAGLAEFLGKEVGGRSLALVPMNQSINAATGAAGRDAVEPAHGGLSKVGGKVGDNDEVIFFGDIPGGGVVIGDGFVLIAQIHLDDLFHVLVKVGETLFDLSWLCPDTPVDDIVLVIGEVHDGGEVLAKGDRVDNGEAHFTGGRGGKEPEDRVVDGGDDLFIAGFGRLE
jgi:hypothetical protein